MIMTGQASAMNAIPIHRIYEVQRYLSHPTTCVL